MITLLLVDETKRFWCMKYNEKNNTKTEWFQWNQGQVNHPYPEILLHFSKTYNNFDFFDFLKLIEDSYHNTFKIRIFFTDEKKKEEYELFKAI